MNEHQKEYKVTQRITWQILWSQPPQTVSGLNNHVTVHIQSKVIIWSCGKNKRTVFNSRSLSVFNLSLTRSPNPWLISKHWKCWWTVAMYVEPFLLFITKRSKFKELELTQKSFKWNIEWVNLDNRACNKMLVWAAD